MTENETNSVNRQDNILQCQNGLTPVGHGLNDLDMTRELKLVEDRRNAIKAERSDIDGQLAKLSHRRSLLDQEESDLKITERTIQRLIGVKPVEDNYQTANANVAATSSRRKPKGLPTILAMVTTIMRERSEQRWFEGAELTMHIQSRWWPNIESSDIGPQLWRFAKEGKLVKVDGKYGLSALSGARAHDFSYEKTKTPP